MQSRMLNPVLMFPEALKALHALDKSTQSHVPHVTRQLVDLRASQINGCSVCLDMHARELKKTGEADDRVFAVGAWRETPYFTDAERAALALTEALTRISDRPDPVPDDIWEAATKNFDEQTLGALIIQIALINVFNRVNVAVKQVVGEWKD